MRILAGRPASGQTCPMSGARAKRFAHGPVVEPASSGRHGAYRAPMPRHARASQTLAADPLWDWWSVAEPALQGYRVFACTAPGFLCDAGHHHDHATIVAGLTHDFRHIAWQSTPILRPSPHRSDNSGLLAGDTMPLATGAVLFYGSRTSQRDDGRTSFITAASSRDGLRWRPEPTCHIAAAAPALTITAPDGEAMLWRDPFTFHHAGRDWMLVAARAAVRDGVHSGNYHLGHHLR